MSRFVGDAYSIAYREWLRYRRDRAYWVGQLAFPLAFVGFIGFGLDSVVKLPTGTGYAAHLASGMLALLVGSGGVGGGMTLITDRESGFLRTLLVAPVSRASIVVGKIVARTLASLLLVLVLVALLAAFTGLRIAHPAAVGLAVGAVTTAFVALGVALGAQLRTLESFRLITSLVTVPLYLLSGIFYPVATLPEPTRWLARVNPLTYGVDLLRYGLLDVAEFPVVRSAVLLSLLTGASIVIAIRRFDARIGH